MNFGENVRRLRAAKGITQEQLAEEIGITQGMVDYPKTTMWKLIEKNDAADPHNAILL